MVNRTADGNRSLETARAPRRRGIGKSGYRPGGARESHHDQGRESCRFPEGIVSDFACSVFGCAATGGCPAPHWWRRRHTSIHSQRYRRGHRPESCTGVHPGGTGGMVSVSGWDFAGFLWVGSPAVGKSPRLFPDLRCGVVRRETVCCPKVRQTPKLREGTGGPARQPAPGRRQCASLRQPCLWPPND